MSHGFEVIKLKILKQRIFSTMLEMNERVFERIQFYLKLSENNEAEVPFYFRSTVVNDKSKHKEE